MYSYYWKVNDSYGAPVLVLYRSLSSSPGGGIAARVYQDMSYTLYGPHGKTTKASKLFSKDNYKSVILEMIQQQDTVYTPNQSLALESHHPLDQLLGSYTRKKS